MVFQINNKQYELILLVTTGSRLYGNATPESDWDYRGIFIESPKDKLSIFPKTSEIHSKELYKILKHLGIHKTDDIVLYELSKFVHLSIDNNPNIMDILFAPKDAIVYSNKKGKEVLDNSKLFLSKKSKFTFSGYAISQLKRIQGHYKMINKYPKVNEIYKTLVNLYNENKIDFNWIVDNFSGQIAEKITSETAQSNKQGNKMPWYKFKKLFDFDVDSYRKPRLIDYCHPKDLKGKQLKLNDFAKIKSLPNVTIKGVMLNYGSFRTFSPSMIALYTGGNGIFTPEGNIKQNDPEEIGDFVCLVSIDYMNYKKDKDSIKKLWDWKAHRNEKRSSLEEKFGYDTKHASHLIRLMLSAKDILEQEVYKPKLENDRLKFVKDVRAGNYTYDEIIKFSEKYDKELNELYKTSKLQNKADVKKINDLVLKLYGIKI